MANLDLHVASGRAEEWNAVLDRLLVGITHNISNRVATLAGVSDILSGDPTIPPILRALADEVPRLEESIRLLRLLAAPENEREEALEVTRLLDDAILLAHLHPACHRLTFEVAGRESVPPAVARPASLTHEIVVALVAAALEAQTEEGDGLVQVTVSAGADELEIAAGGAGVVRARLLKPAGR